MGDEISLGAFEIKKATWLATHATSWLFMCLGESSLTEFYSQIIQGNSLEQIHLFSLLFVCLPENEIVHVFCMPLGVCVCVKS